MGEAIGEVLGFAVGIAVSPVPIAAVILMLLSGRARANSVAFLMAWILGIAAVATVATAIPGLEADGAPSTTTAWVKLVLGALLLLAGIRQWRSRPGPEDEPAAPGWMARIDNLRPLAAMGLGVALSALNPKNLLLAAAGGATIASMGLSGVETAGTVAIFTVIASATIVAPVAAYLVASDHLASTLDRTKDWLIENNAAVMAVLFIVFSASLIGDAVQILAT